MSKGVSGEGVGAAQVIYPSTLFLLPDLTSLLPSETMVQTLTTATNFTSTPLMAILPGRKYVPFKLLALLLYGSYPYVTWLSSRKVRVIVGPLAALLGCTNGKLKDFLSTLQKWGYLSGLRLGYGECDFYIQLLPGTRLCPPPNEQELPHDPPKLSPRKSK